MKNILIVIACLTLAAVLFISVPRRGEVLPISFEECAAQGFPIAESYPRQCRANGKTFVEDIGNVLEKGNLIRVASPRPGEKIRSPLIVAGEARGNWYFEASFPIQLLDSNGRDVSLTPPYITALGEWMTEEFVPFSATLTFTLPQTSTGTLILIKDNPSGHPEFDDELRIPIIFDRK